MAQESFDPMRFYQSPASITYGLNNRRTSILGNSITIFGGYVGVQWGDRLKHVLTTNSSVFWIQPNATTLPPRSYHLNYIGFAEEYALLRWKRWELVSFIHGGYGSFHERSFEASAFTYNKDWVIPVELGGHLAFGINEWLDAIGGAGHRWVLLDQTHALDGFYYKVSLSLDIKALRSTLSQKEAEHDTSFSGLPEP